MCFLLWLNVTVDLLIVFHLESGIHNNLLFKIGIIISFWDEELNQGWLSVLNEIKISLKWRGVGQRGQSSRGVGQRGQDETSQRCIA